MKGRNTRNKLSVSSTSSTSSSDPLSPEVSSRKGLLTPAEYLLSSSPPPSPGLPSLLPWHGKKPHISTRAKLKRLIVVVGALTVFAWLGVHTLYPHRVVRPLNGDYEIVGADSLPEEPTAMMLSDHHGKNKWTVSIPEGLDFPLLPSQYHEICQQAEHMSHEIDPKRRGKGHVGYYDRDLYFLDVSDAQKQGLLPHPVKDAKVSDDGTRENVPAERSTCETSLTYVMETSDAGMGTTLLGLWMAYGLAKKEKRAFFVDDTRWPYGKYSNYFKSPPESNCAPAPSSQRLPCPHAARHLVVSAATFPFTFGASFSTQFLDHRRSSDTYKQRQVYDMLRAGYEALFHLADQGDRSYVIERTEKTFNEVREKGGMNVGLHVRRGDVHPWEYQYEKDYLPIIHYMDEVRQILIDKYEHGHDVESGSAEIEEHTHKAGKLHVDPSQIRTLGVPSPRKKAQATAKGKQKRAGFTETRLLPRHGAPGMMASQLFLSSDDPDIYAAVEVSRALRAQDRIVLASKSVLEAASGPRKNQWVDEVHGWEGGFYRDQFFGLGRTTTHRSSQQGSGSSSTSSTSSSSSHSANGLDLTRTGGVMLEDESPDFAEPPSAEAMATRQLVGRAYLLDLAVLGKSDAVVCAVSASGCRILAVMMGWERAVKQGMWRNVDGGFGWRGLIVPE